MCCRSILENDLSQIYLKTNRNMQFWAKWGTYNILCHPWCLSFGQPGQLLSDLVRFNQDAQSFKDLQGLG